MGDKRLIDNEWMTIDECYEKYKKLMMSLAKRYVRQAANQGAEMGDLKGVAGMGFTKAFNKYDNDQGVKFSTYVSSMVRGEIFKFFRDYGKNIHFPRTVKDLAPEIVLNKLTEATPKVISETLGVDVNNARDALIYLGFSPLSMEKEMNVEEGNMTLHESIGTYQDYTTRTHIGLFRESLGERENRIIEMALQDMSQTEIGLAVGLKQVQISRILRKIKRRYQDYNKGEIA